MRRIIWGVVVLFFPFLLAGQEQARPEELSDTIDIGVDLFDQRHPMDITLTFNLKEFQRKKYRDEYLPVEFTYQINDTVRLVKSMRIKPRGDFRRDFCQLAPFWLNIRQAEVKNQHLQETTKIKIVTHCGNSSEYLENVLKEYLVYRIYNLLTEVSFRVRLINMTYVDTGRKERITRGWAFMIEPEEMLAGRNHALVIKKDDLGMRLMDPEAFDLMALFMYMIGNSDYSVAGRHNVKILGLEGFGSRGYTPVPYDFDYCGLVDASYATPGENLGIKSVKDRYFLGLCREDDDYLEAMEKINDHREEILQLVGGFEYLGERERSEIIHYLESYFTMTSQPGYLIGLLKSTCR
jgi:hypothetical protein